MDELLVMEGSRHFTLAVSAEGHQGKECKDCAVSLCQFRTSLDAVLHFLRHDFANFFHYNDMIDVHPPGVHI